MGNVLDVMPFLNAYSLLINKVGLVVHDLIKGVQYQLFARGRVSNRWPSQVDRCQNQYVAIDSPWPFPCWLSC